MSNNNFLLAISIISNSTFSNLKFDKTIIATIIEIVNLEEGEYRADYECGLFKIYSTTGEEFKVGDSVYVTIPEGDYSNKKFIKGKVSNKSNNNNKDLSNIIVYDNIKFDLTDLSNNSDTKNMFYNYLKTYVGDLLKLSGDFQGKIHLKDEAIQTAEDSPILYGINLYKQQNNELKLIGMLSTENMNGNIILYNIPTKQSAYFTIEEDWIKDNTELVVEGFFNEKYCSLDKKTPMSVDNITFEFCKIVDFSKDTYYAKINYLNTTSLEAVLYKEGKLVNSNTLKYQWYIENAEQDTGWTEALEEHGANTSILTIDKLKSQKYKVEIFYEENKSITQTFKPNNLTNVTILTELLNDGNYRIYLSDNSPATWYIRDAGGGIISEYYKKTGTEIEFPKDLVGSFIKVSCIILPKEDSSNELYVDSLLSTYIIAENEPLELEITSDFDLFHYNANSDIADAFVNSEYTLLYIYRGSDTISLVQWKLKGEGELDVHRLNPAESMMKNIWVDSSNIVHFSIKDTYAILNWKNTFQLILTLNGNNETQKIIEKEIYFIKDGQQGTNNSDYCAIVIPVSQEGKLISPLEGLLCSGDPTVNYKYFSVLLFYKGKIITDPNRYSVTWNLPSELRESKELIFLYDTVEDDVDVYKWEGNICRCYAHWPAGTAKFNYHYVTATIAIYDTIKTQNVISTLYYNYPLASIEYVDYIISTDTHKDKHHFTITELEYPKYIEYSVNGTLPLYLSKPLKCSVLVANNPPKVYDLINVGGKVGNIDNNNLLIAPAEFDFAEGIGYIVFEPLSNDSNIVFPRIYCPVMMYINMLGGANIKGWDGTSIRLSDNESILTPLVGAGEKDENGRFTGVVMGKTSQQDSGLYGYNNGKSAFGLTKNGYAYFGENKEVELNKDTGEYDTEGKKILANYIGGWKTDYIGGENKKHFRFTGGNTELDTVNGITTNKITISTEKVSGSIGEIVGAKTENDVTIPTYNVGIASSSDNSIILETPNSIRLSNQDNTPATGIYLKAQDISVWGSKEKTKLSEYINLISWLQDLEQRITNIEKTLKDN